MPNRDMYVWQLNIFRAKFEDEFVEKFTATSGEPFDKQKLQWKIEYSGEGELGQRSKEFTPTNRRKPTWNYWTQIRDVEANNLFTFTLLNKTASNSQLGYVQVSLLQFRSKPDQGQDFWVKVYAEPECDKATDGGTIIGQLHVNITYKTFKVDTTDQHGDCVSIYCTKSDESAPCTIC